MSPQDHPLEPLPPGSPAPPFRLLSADAAAVPPGDRPRPQDWRSLDDVRGAPVVLVFYPADFTPVCGDELAIFSELLPELERHGARVFGISVDSAWCHRAFAQEKRLRLPLLADFQPKGEVARRYGCYREEDGFCERALFVLDRRGNVFWSAVSPLAVNPGVEGVLEALERLDQDQPADAAAAPPPRSEQREEGRP